jgi:hypothetical protein
VGAITLRWAEYALSGGLQMVVTGAGVLLLLLVFPGGLSQLSLRARDGLLRRIASRRGLVVPSLFDDRRVESDAAAVPVLDEVLGDDAARMFTQPGTRGDREMQHLQARVAELEAIIRSEVQTTGKGESR